MTLNIIFNFVPVIFFIWSHIQKRFYSTVDVITHKRNITQFTNKHGKQEDFKPNAVEHFMLGEKTNVDIDIKACFSSSGYPGDSHFSRSYLFDSNQNLVGKKQQQFVSFLNPGCTIKSKLSDVIIHPHLTDQLKEKDFEKLKKSVEESEKKKED